MNQPKCGDRGRIDTGNRNNLLNDAVVIFWEAPNDNSHWIVELAEVPDDVARDAGFRVGDKIYIDPDHWTSIEPKETPGQKNLREWKEADAEFLQWVRPKLEAIRNSPATLPKSDWRAMPSAIIINPPPTETITSLCPEAVCPRSGALIYPPGVGLSAEDWLPRPISLPHPTNSPPPPPEQGMEAKRAWMEEMIKSTVLEMVEKGILSKPSRPVEVSWPDAKVSIPVTPDMSFNHKVSQIQTLIQHLRKLLETLPHPWHDENVSEGSKTKTSYLALSDQIQLTQIINGPQTQLKINIRH